MDVYWASGSFFEGMLLFDANYSTTPQCFWSIFMSTYSGNKYKGVYYEMNPFSADTKADNTTTVSQSTWYTFSAKRVGTTLYFYHDDNLMYIEYNAIDPGIEFALTSSSYMPEVIYFDNFTVKYYESASDFTPTIDSPANVVYEEGQTGYSITWTPSDTDPANFNITRDGVLVKEGLWNSSGEAITISVDGLSPGTHTYRCNVYDIVYRGVFDEVEVIVTGINYEWSSFIKITDNPAWEVHTTQLPNGTYALYYLDYSGNHYRILTNDFIVFSTPTLVMSNTGGLQIYRLLNGTYMYIYGNVSANSVYYQVSEDF